MAPPQNPDAHRAVTRLANQLVWKRPDTDVIDDSRADQYPWWIITVHEKLVHAVQRQDLLLPDLRALGNTSVAVFSDYGGEHDTARFRTYAFLVCGLQLARPFQDRMAAIRCEHDLGQSEIAYKKFGKGRIVDALQDYLTAANNLLPGLLFTLLVDKRITTLFGMDTPERKARVAAHFEQEGFGRRKSMNNEKALRIAHMAAMLTGLLTHSDQKIFWMTDDDSISANSPMARSTLRLFAALLEMYRRQDVQFGDVGGATPFAQRHPETLDLLSLCDIVAGSLGHYMSERETVPRDQVKVKQGADTVLDWLPHQGIGLRKMNVILRQADNNAISFAALVAKSTSPPSDHMNEVPIFL